MLWYQSIPIWFQKLFKGLVWQIPNNTKEVYLTFDDGPHPVATPFVLDELKKYKAKATFFCIGKNVVAYPDIYQRILDEGHRTGNHTQNHLNGWKTNNGIYLNNIEEATNYIDSELFRPPYGKIKASQAKRISSVIKKENPKIIMWSVLSGDFDENISKEKCLRNVTQHTNGGSIVVFHDSEKAFPRLEYALPAILQFFTKSGFVFEVVG